MKVAIRIQGYLDSSWQPFFEGLHIIHEADGTARLSNTLPDQPALQGVLTKIGRLSLTLLSLTTSESTDDKEL